MRGGLRGRCGASPAPVFSALPWRECGDVQYLRPACAASTAHALTPLALHKTPYFHRRVLTMEWIQGVKLTTLSPEEIQDLVKVGQEAFLIQLLEVSAEEEGREEGRRGGFGQSHTSPHSLMSAPDRFAPSLFLRPYHRSASSTVTPTQVRVCGEKQGG